MPKNSMIGDRRLVVPRGNRGAWAEAIAIVWLLERGYEVFSNVSSHGGVDIVVLAGDQVLLVDVKTIVPWVKKDGSLGRTNGPKLTSAQRDRGVQMLIVHSHSGEVSWQ